MNFELPASSAERGLTSGLLSLGASLLWGGAAAALVAKYRLPVLAIPAAAFAAAWVTAEAAVPAVKTLLGFLGAP
jgi:hypothetical protein